VYTLHPIDLYFEWDEEKAAENLTKHGVSFLTAAAIFNYERVERVDDRENYGELRIVALGRVDMTVYRVVYTPCGEKTIRIISARKAGRHEQDIYYRQAFPA
jgi:uncharacterized DUF497 family protein